MRLDYNPFGSVIPGRSFSTPSYRYGYNGKEKDDEVKGSGNSLDFDARIYDCRLGKWFSVDAYSPAYSNLSPYSYVNNSPIQNKEVDGNYWVSVHVCYTGSCPAKGDGHQGFNMLSSAIIMVNSAKILKAVNLAGCVPLSPELTVASNATKMALAMQDNSINFGASDWAGVLLNVIGFGMGKDLEKLGHVDAAAALDFIISTAQFSAEQYQDFKGTDYYNLLLDAEGVKILEEKGYGKVDGDGNFSFSSEWLAKEHDIAVDKITSDKSNKKVPFGGTLYEYQAQEKVQEKINHVMKQAKTQAAGDLDKKFEEASKKNKK